MRIREESSLKSKEIEIIKAGTKVEVIECVGGWCKVEKGFIKSEYLV